MITVDSKKLRDRLLGIKSRLMDDSANMKEIAKYITSEAIKELQPLIKASSLPDDPLAQRMARVSGFGLSEAAIYNTPKTESGVHFAYTKFNISPGMVKKLRTYTKNFTLPLVLKKERRKIIVKFYGKFIMTGNKDE